jgi:hypothetical protein
MTVSRRPTQVTLVTDGRTSVTLRTDVTTGPVTQAAASRDQPAVVLNPPTTWGSAVYGETILLA